MSSQIEIAIRLEKLREYLKILKHLGKTCSLADLKKDPVLKGALERYLQLSAEAAIDIGEIIISEKKLSAPMFYSEIFEILGKENILPKKMAASFSDIAKFRNVLVHDYLKVDLNKMYGYLKNDLSDFEKFIKHIAQYVVKN